MTDHVKARWRWGQIGPREVKDLGTVTLRPAGTIKGRIVDSKGQPLVGRSASVHAREIARDVREGCESAYEDATIDRVTATFMLSRLPAGDIVLRVSDRQFGWSKPHGVTVVAGETVATDFLVDVAEEFAGRVVLWVSQVIY